MRTSDPDQAGQDLAAMRDQIVPRQVFVDWNRVGNKQRFTVPLTIDEATGLAVGHPVILVGEPGMAVPARVVRLDGLDASVEPLAAHAPEGADTLYERVAVLLRPFVSDVAVAGWWLTPQPELGEVSPAIWLERGGEAATVMEAARHTAGPLAH